MLPSHPLRSWTALIVVSALVGWALGLAHFPAAFLIGPMLGGIAVGIGGGGIAVPRPAFQCAQAVIGCLVARSVTHVLAATLLDDGLIMLAVVLVTVAVGALVGLALTRLQVLPGTAAAWGSAPGGAAAMVAMSEAYGSDPRLVAFMQYVRVAAVVLSASIAARLLADISLASPETVKAEPMVWSSVAATLGIAAAGAALAVLLRIPAGALVGPMIIGAVLHATGTVDMALPGPLLDVAYAVIGCSVGLRFTTGTLRAMLHALPGILVATAAIIVICAGWAWCLTRLLSIDLLTAFLATSPGGLDSVAIIAVGSKVDVPFVLGVQTMRLFVVLLTGPLLAKWIARAAPGGHTNG